MSICMYECICGEAGKGHEWKSEEPEREEGKGERANEERKMPDEGIDETKDGTYERDA